MNAPRRWALMLVSAAIAPALLLGQRRESAAPAGRAPFVDVTAASGITFVHGSGASPEKRQVESLGSGVAWIDYDNDGYPDLFFVGGAPGSPNALYHNGGHGTFTDVTRQAGVDQAALKFFKTGVAVGDYDNDGYLDLYVANYLDYKPTDSPYCGFQKPGFRTYCSPAIFDGVADRLFRNNGNGTFTDVSKAAGIANPAGKGLGVTFCDVDRDGRVDIYVANDLVRNFLYHNNGDGTFRDIAYGAGVGLGPEGKPRAGMGTDCADIDGNGYPDLLVTNLEDELNGLFRNNGDGTFDDIGASAGFRSSFPYVGFGTKLFDADNDGDLDVIVANGHIIDNVALYRPTSSFAQKMLFYENNGAGRFVDVTAQSGPALQAKRVGRGLAVADMDNDGDLDVVVSNQGQPAVLLRNQASGANWLIVRAQGKQSNRFGLGARVELEAGGKRQVREINNVASYESSNDVRLHFGLGAAAAIDRISVYWPSGKTQVLTNVHVNQILLIAEP